jgi:hypothetical protein
MKMVALRKSKYAKLYRWVIEDVKDRYEIKVRHRKLATSFGQYDFKNRTVIIDKEIAGTVFGIFSLLHECQHVIDCAKGLYPDFYEKVLYGETDGIDLEKVVWEAEWNCCIKALQHLRRLGIDSYNQFCDKKWVKSYILPVWISYYTPKK